MKLNHRTMRCEYQSVVVCESFGLVSRLMLVCLPALLKAEALSVHLQDMDMDSSENPVHGQQEGAAYNRHFGCVCYHPLFLFNQFGDCERATLRPGNVHSAEGWKDTRRKDRGCCSGVTLLLPSQSYTSIWNNKRSGTPSGLRLIG